MALVWSDERTTELNLTDGMGDVIFSVTLVLMSFQSHSLDLFLILQS